MSSASSMELSMHSMLVFITEHIYTEKTTVIIAMKAMKHQKKYIELEQVIYVTAHEGGDLLVVQPALPTVSRHGKTTAIFKFWLSSKSRLLKPSTFDFCYMYLQKSRKLKSKLENPQPTSSERLSESDLHTSGREE